MCRYFIAYITRQKSECKEEVVEIFIAKWVTYTKFFIFEKHCILNPPVKYVLLTQFYRLFPKVVRWY